MFRFKKVIILVIVVAIVSGLISCDNENTGDANIQLIGDVFVLKRILDEKNQYGYTYYLYGNYPLSSANVTTPNGEIIPLPASDQLSLVFSKDPDSNDYSENTPQNGTFDFSAIHLDQKFNSTDELDFIDMDIPVIASTEYLGSTETLKIEWNSVPEADSYIVRMINIDSEVFFTGYLLDKDATSYEINQNTGTWLDQPNYNDPFVLELHASRYEENVDELETYHIEEITIAEKTVYWGVE